MAFFKKLIDKLAPKVLESRTWGRPHARRQGNVAKCMVMSLAGAKDLIYPRRPRVNVDALWRRALKEGWATHRGLEPTDFHKLVRAADTSLAHCYVPLRRRGGNYPGETTEARLKALLDVGVLVLTTESHARLVYSYKDLKRVWPLGTMLKLGTYDSFTGRHKEIPSFQLGVHGVDVIWDGNDKAAHAVVGGLLFNH